METSINLPLKVSTDLTLVFTHTKYLFPLFLTTSAFATSFSPYFTGVLYLMLATPVKAALADVYKRQEIIENKNQIKGLLERQVSNSILWEKSVRTMVENEVTIFVEIGPGKALNGFIRKIDRNLKAVNIEDMNTLKKVEKDVLEGLK